MIRKNEKKHSENTHADPTYSAKLLQHSLLLSDTCADPVLLIRLDTPCLVPYKDRCGSLRRMMSTLNSNNHSMV
jgi:hypothetical protein